MMNKLRKCHYCGGEPIQYTHAEMNYIGENGFKSTIRCKRCGNKIERWAKGYKEAEERAAYNWNGGVENEI